MLTDGRSYHTSVDKMKNVYRGPSPSMLKEIEVERIVSIRTEEDSRRSYLCVIKSWVDEHELIGHEELINDYWKHEKKQQHIESQHKQLQEEQQHNKSTDDNASAENNKQQQELSVEASTSLEVSASSTSAESSTDNLGGGKTSKKRKTKTLDDIVRQISALSEQPPEKRTSSNERMRTLDKSLEKMGDDGGPRGTSEKIVENDEPTVFKFDVGASPPSTRVLSCRICAEVFPTDQSLKHHELTHDLFTCRNCSELFKSKLDLEKHMATSHKTRQKFYKCRYCSTLYANEKQLALHENRHFQGAPYPPPALGGVATNYPPPSTGSLPPPLMQLEQDSVEYPPKKESHLSREPEPKEKAEEEEEDCGNELVVDERDAERSTSPVFMKTEECTSPRSSGHKCPECSKSFHTKETFEYHWQTEHNHHQRFPCNYCGKIFVNKEVLDSHVATHCHSNKDLVCGFCDKLFESRAHYEVHLRSHAMERPFQCNVCLCAFSLRTNLRRHMLTHTEIHMNQFTCQLCPKAFKRSDNLAYHMLDEHNIRPPPRLQAEEKTSLKREEKPRVFTPTDRYPPSDSEPPRLYKDEKQNEDFRCEEIKKEQKLRFHNYQPEGADKEPQLSPGCFNRHLIQNMKVSPHPLYMNKPSLYPGMQPLTSPGYLSKHHLPNEAFKLSPMRNSPSSQQQVSTPPSMLYHNGKPVSNQTSPKPVNILPHPGVTECAECGEKFTSGSLYEIHMQSHRKQAYACKKCPKTFARRNHYDAHMQTHENGKAKTHNCPYCHRLFSMKGNLRRHIRIHTNEAPYECPICFQRFRRSDGLKGHIRRHETLGESAPNDLVPSQAQAAST